MRCLALVLLALAGIQALDEQGKSLGGSGVRLHGGEGADATDRPRGNTRVACPQGLSRGLCGNLGQGMLRPALP